MKELFDENSGRYGYRRIHALLKKENSIISEKIVRGIMKEENLTIRIRKMKKYNSYKGEITPTVDNLLKRDFHADKKNQKWVTDITEFAISAGKVYLSSLMDCFDGYFPSWTIGI